MAEYTHDELSRHADGLMNELVCLAVDFAMILRPVELVSEMTEEEMNGQANLIHQILEAMKELGHTTLAIEGLEEVGT